MHPFKAAFQKKMGSRQQLEALFEYLPRVHYFMKDRHSRMVSASSGIVRRFRLKREDELIGKSDFDFFPSYVAERFVQDDQRVLKSGKPLADRIEIWFTDEGLLDWFVTTKLPVFDERGEIIGVMGIVSQFDGARRSRLESQVVEEIVRYIGSHYHENIRIRHLADRFHYSPRQLHRKFVQSMGMSILDFIIRTRIQAACKMLMESEQEIASIAQSLGFCDQSAFTRQFRETVGMTPLRFRRRHGVAHRQGAKDV